MIRKAVLLAVLSTASAAQASDVFEVRLSRHGMSAPGAVRITALVAQHDDHRSLTIEVDSPSFFQSSTIQPDGATAQRSVSRILAVSHQMAEVHGEPTATVRSQS